MGFKVVIRHIWNQLRLYLSFILLVFYLTVGFLFLFSDIWSHFLTEGREIVGLVLILYSVLRFYIAYRRFKAKHIKIQVLKEQKRKHKTSEPENATTE